MLRDRKGQALLVVLLLTTSIFLVGGAAVTMGTTVRKNAAREVHSAKAYYVAEAGVEKVLAKARRDPNWLQALPGPGDPRDFIAEDLGGQQAYAGGRFVEIKVSKEDAGWNAVLLHIKSKGEYLGATRTLDVDARIDNAYGHNLFRRLWVKSLTEEKLSHGMVVTGEVMASEGDLVLEEGSDVAARDRGLWVQGNLTVKGQMSQGKQTQIQGNVWCVGNVSFVKLGGGEGQPITIYGNLYVQQGSVQGLDDVNITGTVYVRNANQLPAGWRDAHPGKWQVDSSLDVASRIPSFPQLLTPERLEWYRRNADRYMVGPVMFEGTHLRNLSGLYYIEGDATFSGEYSGRATFVVHGNVTFLKYSGRDKASLVRTSENDCVTILCTGDIDTQNANGEIQALLYSPGGADGSADIKNKTDLVGAAVLPNIKSHGYAIDFRYDENMVNTFEGTLNWTTSWMTVTSWRE